MESAVAAYHPEDRPIVEAALKSSLENKTDFQFSLRIIRPSGEIRNVFSQGHCELNDKDDITKLFGIFQDITEQKELEIALLKSQARLQDFADVSSNWFWELDAELRFSYLGDQFESVTGFPPEKLLGKTLEQVGAPGSDPAAYKQLLSNLHEHREFKNFVHNRTNPDGKIIWVSLSAKPAYDENDNFIGFRGIGRDITEQKASELKLIESRDAANETATSLRESQKRLKQSGTLAQIGYWLWDTIEGKLISCSEECARIHGLS